MRCNTCGSSVPSGRAECDTCGANVRMPVVMNGRAGGVAAPAGNRIALCPRCEYHGQGLPYFSRGMHTAGLVGATLFTLPYALGAGGFLYYVLRREHRICPRCGKNWGHEGEYALQRTEGPVAARMPARGSGETTQRTLSVFLFVLAAILLVVGVTGAEVMPAVIGTLSAAGGVVLHRAANQSREERRARLLAALQSPVLKLASERDGRLTVTEVAASLGWSMPRAEKILHSLDDGWRVNSEVTDEGVIVYEFREILLGRESSAPEG